MWRVWVVGTCGEGVHSRKLEARSRKQHPCLIHQFSRLPALHLQLPIHPTSAAQSIESAWLSQWCKRSTGIQHSCKSLTSHSPRTLSKARSNASHSYWILLPITIVMVRSNPPPKNLPEILLTPLPDPHRHPPPLRHDPPRRLPQKADPRAAPPAALPHARRQPAQQREPAVARLLPGAPGLADAGVQGRGVFGGSGG